MNHIQSFIAKIFFALFFVVCFSDLSGQNYYMENILHLKNGSEIRGWIVEQVPGEYVKIELVGGSILVYRQDEIEKISSEPNRYSQVIRRINRNKNSIQYRNYGMYNFLTSGFTINDGRWGPNADFSFYYRAGYRFNQYLGVGLGGGIEEYETGILAPVFAEVSGDFLQKRNTPFYLVQAGYGFGVDNSWITDDFDGGLMYYIGTGVKRHTRSRFESTIGMGYKSNQLTESLIEWTATGEILRTVRNRTVRGMVFQVSLGF
ncbi:MAG: hypothetical protein R3C61_13225 [Bacteroidia bacterium]